MMATGWWGGILARFAEVFVAPNWFIRDANRVLFFFCCLSRMGGVCQVARYGYVREYTDGAISMDKFAQTQHPSNRLMDPVPPSPRNHLQHRRPFCGGPIIVMPRRSNIVSDCENRSIIRPSIWQ